MELKDRIRKARRDAGLTQSELAGKVGVTQASISELERGQTKASVHLLKIAQACNVDPVWLSEGDSHPATLENMRASHPADDKELTEYLESTQFLEPPSVFLGQLDSWEDADPLDDDDCEVPYYTEVEFAGGNGMTEVVEVADRKLRFSRATLRAAGVDARAAACARIRGRSMERLILDGAAIGFDTTDTAIIDGEIYAFNQGGMLRVKYLYRLPNGGVRVRSENAEEFPEETLSAQQYQDEIRMLGRVFWWSTVRRSPRRLRT